MFAKYVTLYADGEVHDDVSPIDAPRRASWRPGLFLSHVPGVPRLDLRVEAADTDPPVDRSVNGHFMYFEGVQVQGYTNKGQLFGDWIGREDKGGQAWVTYHLSGNEWVQVSVRNQKAAKDFAELNNANESGTTLNDINFQAVKRIGPDLELNGTFTYERYKAPLYLPGQQTVTNTNIQLTWYPGSQSQLLSQRDEHRQELLPWKRLLLSADLSPVDDRCVRMPVARVRARAAGAHRSKTEAFIASLRWRTGWSIGCRFRFRQGAVLERIALQTG